MPSNTAAVEFNKSQNKKSFFKSKRFLSKEFLLLYWTLSNKDCDIEVQDENMYKNQYFRSILFCIFYVILANNQRICLIITNMFQLITVWK